MSARVMAPLREPLSRAARDLLEAEARRTFFSAAQVRLTEHRRERAVSLG